MKTRIYTDAEIIAKNEETRCPIIENGITYAIHGLHTFYGEVTADNEVGFVATEAEARDLVARMNASVERDNEVLAAKTFYYFKSRTVR